MGIYTQNNFTHLRHIVISINNEMDNSELFDDFSTKFGQKLKKERELKRYTLDDLEFYTTIDSSDINKIELGQRNITLRTLLKLSQGLNIHPKKLFDFDLETHNKDL